MNDQRKFVRLLLCLSLCLTACLAQSSQPSPGTISNHPNNNVSGNPSDGGAQGQPNAQGSPGAPNNNGYSEYNSGVQPYSYGYNTGIRPYSYTYTYPQNGGRPQVTYNGQPAYAGGAPPQAPPGYVQPYPQPYPMPPLSNAYPGYNGYPGQPMQGYAGYPPPPMPPINMMPAGPNIPITPGLPNIGATPGFNPAEFDLPVTGGGNSNNQGNNQNGFEDFNVDQALGANDNDNGNAGNNDLNSELANLANPAAVGGANRNNNNNNNNNNALSANAAQIPTSLNDFQIDGLGGNSNGNLNNNGNNNAGNNAFNGLPTDILSQLGAANPNPSNNNNNGNGDFGDLGLGNLGGNSPARSNNGQDFNFGGSNNNMNFDLNFPAASDIQNHKIHRLELNMKKLAKDRLHKLVAADSKLLKQAQRSVLKGKDEKPGKLV